MGVGSEASSRVVREDLLLLADHFIFLDELFYLLLFCPFNQKIDHNLRLVFVPGTFQEPVSWAGLFPCRFDWSDMRPSADGRLKGQRELEFSF